MAKPRTLVPRNGYLQALIIVMLLAVLFRFVALMTLPPGLSSGEARIGLAAFNLLHHGVWPNFGLASGGSPLLVWLEVLAIQLFGTAPWILRLVPAAIGIGATWWLYLWAEQWFGKRTAVMAALLLAVTPWSVTLSRNVEPAALAPLLLASLFYFSTRLWHGRSLRRALPLTVVAAFAALAGPVGWGALATVAIVGLVTILGHPRRPNLKFSGLGLAAGLLALAPAVVIALSQRDLSAVLHLPDLGKVGAGALSTLLAFQIHGDTNFLHNLGGEPLLNVFIGIMFVAGVLITATRWPHRTDRALLVAGFAALLPALLSPQTAPDAARLSLALPGALILSALGIGYMLEVWYATFPINSAARLTGQISIMILLGLTVYQGYTQYFVAWAHSSETQRVYGDTPLGMAQWVRSQPAKAPQIIVATPSEQFGLQYGLLNRQNYQLVSASHLTTALAVRPLHLVVSPSLRDQAVTALKTSAPGGTLNVHQSTFDQADLYYTYDLP